MCHNYSIHNTALMHTLQNILHSKAPSNESSNEPQKPADTQQDTAQKKADADHAEILAQESHTKELEQENALLHKKNELVQRELEQINQQLQQQAQPQPQPQPQTPPQTPPDQQSTLPVDEEDATPTFKEDSLPSSVEEEDDGPIAGITVNRMSEEETVIIWMPSRYTTTIKGHTYETKTPTGVLHHRGHLDKTYLNKSVELTMVPDKVYKGRHEQDTVLLNNNGTFTLSTDDLNKSVHRKIGREGTYEVSFP